MSNASEFISFVGLEELQARLRENVRLEDVKQMVKYHGSQMQQTAHDLAPNDTGRLQDSIKLELTDGGFTAEVAPHTDYAAYVEYGTRFMEAQPYIRPAFMQESARFKAELARLVR